MAEMSVGLSASSGATSPGKTTTVGSASAGRIGRAGELAISANPWHGDPQRARRRFRHVNQKLTVGHLQADARRLAVRREPDPSHETAPRRLDQMRHGVLGMPNHALAGNGHGLAEHRYVDVTRANSGQRQAEYELLGQLEHVQVRPPVDFGTASPLLKKRA